MRFACPGCGAIYDIKDESKLEATGGKVECYRCHEVFAVALPPEATRERPPTEPVPPPAAFEPKVETAPDIQSPMESPPSPAPDEPPSSVPERPAPPPMAKPRLRPAAKSGTRSPADDTVSSTGAGEDATAETSRHSAVEGVITGARKNYEIGKAGDEDLSVATGFTDQTDLLADHFTEDDRRTGSLASRALWSVGSVSLALILAAQTVWAFRSEPRVHMMLATICEDIGCDIPLPREPGLLEVIDRVFTRDPDYPDVLVLRLRLVNDAGFRQPYPGVELVLYDNAQAVVGKSRVVPRQYLAKGSSDVLDPGMLGEIELVILDPGQAATGFAVEFF